MEGYVFANATMHQQKYTSQFSSTNQIRQCHPQFYELCKKTQNEEIWLEKCRKKPRKTTANERDDKRDFRENVFESLSF